ncbi:hypothetical protein ACWCQP_48745 [Streptomyces chartreusis]
MHKNGQTVKEGASYTRVVNGLRWEDGDWKLSGQATLAALAAAQKEGQPKMAAPGDAAFKRQGGRRSGRRREVAARGRTPWALAAVFGVSVVAGPQPARADGVIGDVIDGACQISLGQIIGSGTGNPAACANGAANLCDKIGEVTEKKIKVRASTPANGSAVADGSSRPPCTDWPATAASIARRQGHRPTRWDQKSLRKSSGVTMRAR